jgi:hypothetical protein
VLAPALCYGAATIGLGVLALAAGDAAAAEQARDLIRVAAPAAFLGALVVSVVLLIVDAGRHAKRARNAGR